MLRFGAIKKLREMATFVLIIHEYDRLARRRFVLPPVPSYLICDVLAELRRRSHSVRVRAGAEHQAEGDVALLHVDCTVVPAGYIDLARQYPVALNVAVADISKRKISQALIGRDSDWDGPVIVKSNHNARAHKERLHNRLARRRGQTPPHRDFDHLPPYAIYPSSMLVPERLWDDGDFVVEKFLAEKEADGYGMRIWHFLGKEERCTRYVSPAPIIKTDSPVTFEPVPVPDNLRETRRRLGFDYGKWDFVVHDGRAVLIDANKTPGRPPNAEGRRDRLVSSYADDLESRV
jgi:hypothetical protein